MPENFERPPEEVAGKDPEKTANMYLQELRENADRLEKPPQKLQYLIGEFDRGVFPNNPVEVNIESKPEEPWGEGEEVWLSGHEEEGGKKKWVYEINPEMKEDNFDELLGMAVHEVRHRVQREADIETFTNKDDFTDKIDKYTKLRQYKEKIIEYANMIAEKRKLTEGKLPPEIEEQEFDALVAEVISPAMMKRGMSVQEVGEEFIKADTNDMLANLDRRL